MLTFKDIPYQLKLNDGTEHRAQLGDRFVQAVSDATLETDNIIFSRKWQDLSVRYGQVEDVMKELLEEFDALYPKTTLDHLVSQAKAKKQPEAKKYYTVSLEDFKNATDWKERLYMLDHYDNPDESDYDFLSYAMTDEKLQVRRMAVSLLSLIEEKSTLPYLKEALKDRAIPVRRTAADAYSDLGFKEGLEDMHQALDDKSPIIRWRAAMFIYESGDESSLEVLRAHLDEPQYDVRLQIEMAITRIEQGEEALGSVWKQMQYRER